MRLLTEADLDIADRDARRDSYQDMLRIARQMGRDVVTNPRRFWRRLAMACGVFLVFLMLLSIYWALYLVRAVNR